MARKKKQLPLLENVLITGVAAEGKALARVDDLVVFVPYVVPGDVVDLQVKRKKNHYAEAVAVRFHTYSPVRVTPFCRHYGVCGGCKWQCLDYAEQIKYKQQQVVDNARALAHGLMSRGMNLVSGGTDNHLALVDLRNLGDLTGKELERRLDEVRITVNKNKVPGDPRSPFQTSGIRVGSPAVTSRGFTTADMDQVAQYIVWAATDFENKAEEIRQGVAQLTQAHPIYR